MRLNLCISIPYFSAHCFSDHRISNPNPNPTLIVALTMTVLTFWSEMRWSEMQWAEKGVTMYLNFIFTFIRHSIAQ